MFDKVLAEAALCENPEGGAERGPGAHPGQGAQAQGEDGLLHHPAHQARVVRGGGH